MDNTQSKGLLTTKIFSWFRSIAFLRWHLLHVVWAFSALTLLVIALWKALIKGEVWWVAFVWGWSSSSIYFQGSSFLEVKTDEVKTKIESEIKDQTKR